MSGDSVARSGSPSESTFFKGPPRRWSPSSARPRTSSIPPRCSTRATRPHEARVRLAHRPMVGGPAVERLERGEPVTADEAEFLWELAQEHVDDLLIALQPRRSQWTKSPL